MAVWARTNSGLVLFLLLVGAAGLAESRVRIVVISFIAHRVQVRLPSSGGQTPPRWRPALLSAPVVEGESIRTQARGEAEVELECGSALRLAPNSEMLMSRLRRGDNGVPQTTVDLVAGEAYFSLRNGDSHGFQVQLPGGEVSLPSGEARLRLDVPAGKPASVEVLGGSIHLRSGPRETTLASKHRLELLPGGGFRKLGRARADAWQKWSHERDQAFERAVMAAAPQPPPLGIQQATPSNIGLAVQTVAPDPGTRAQQDQIFSDMESRLPFGPVGPGTKALPPVPACGRG